MSNAFYFGDNLHILREYIPDESVDLIYLDPPFNSNASYNLLFKSPDKSKWSDAQIATFEDTWSWGEAAEETFCYIEMQQGRTGEVLGALRLILGENDMLAYLTMMAARLVELERVLKSTGSIYLHCDPTASHYIKVILDGVFGASFFRSEISWKRSTSHGNVRSNYGALRDVLLYYTKSNKFCWNQQYHEFSDQYLKKYSQTDPDGRRWQSVTLRNPSVRPNLQYEFTASDGNQYEPHPNGWAVSEQRLQTYDREGRLHFPSKRGGQLRLKQYLDERNGVRLQNSWDDIPPINSQARERLGYPTQKPTALLERILATSTQEGDIVLDPFCGCGTTLHAAESLGRTWYGIDVAVQAMKVVQDRLKNYFPTVSYDIYGIPRSPEGAQFLAEKHPFKFEEWAVSFIGGMHSGKYRGDKGIDGTFYYLTDRSEKSRGIISVKGGRSLNPGMIRDLAGTLERERRQTKDPKAIAVFVCAHEPTKGMLKEARDVRTVDTFTGPIPAIQILSIKDIFEGATIRVPAMFDSVTAAAAGRASRKGSAGFIDPRELRRQRSMLFSFDGGGSSGAVANSSSMEDRPMPEPLRKAG